MSYPLPTPAAPMPVPDLPRLRKVLDHIDAHPDEWRQASWAIDVVDLDRTARYMEVNREPQVTACGTAFCLAGHTVLQAGMDVFWTDTFAGHRSASRVATSSGPASIRVAARDLLGLTDEEAWSLFDGRNKRADVQRVAERIAARAGETL